MIFKYETKVKKATLIFLYIFEQSNFMIFLENIELSSQRLHFLNYLIII